MKTTLKEKVSYLVGLVEGLSFEDSKEFKVIKNIIEILQEMADEIEKLKETQEEMEDYIECLDEDLGDLEVQFYNDNNKKLTDAEPEYVEVVCPNCSETVYLDEDLAYGDDEEIYCPNCNEPIYLEDEFDDDEDYYDDSKDTKNIED